MVTAVRVQCSVARVVSTKEHSQAAMAKMTIRPSTESGGEMYFVLKECFTGENTPPLPCYVLIQLYI